MDHDFEQSRVKVLAQEPKSGNLVVGNVVCHKIKREVCMSEVIANETFDTKNG